MAALVAGCNASADATTKTRCDVGGRPGYFVPKPEESPLAIIGCARLGVSTKPVEFSANSERIGGRDHVCLNPAYRGRGRLGIYIPAVCVPDPVSRRLAVIRVEVPRQAVRGYRLVIWGGLRRPSASSSWSSIPTWRAGGCSCAPPARRRRARPGSGRGRVSVPPADQH